MKWILQEKLNFSIAIAGFFFTPYDFFGKNQLKIFIFILIWAVLAKIMPFLRFIIVFNQKTRFLSISEFFLLTKRSFNESGLFFIRVREVFWKILFQIFYGFYDFRWLCKTLRQTESSKSPLEFNPNTSPLKRRMPNYQYIKEFNFNKITFFHLFLFFIGKMTRAIDVDVATMSTNHRHSYINLKRHCNIIDWILF